MKASTALEAGPMPIMMMIGMTSATVGVALSISTGSSTAFQPLRHRPSTTLVVHHDQRQSKTPGKGPKRDRSVRPNFALGDQSPALVEGSDRRPMK